MTFEKYLLRHLYQADIWILTIAEILACKKDRLS